MIHKVLVRSLFQHIQVFLQSGHFPTQFGNIGKLHQGMLDSIILSTYEDIKQHWAWYRSLRDPTCDRLPIGAINSKPAPSGCGPSATSTPTAETTCLDCNALVSLGGDYRKLYGKPWRNPGRLCSPLTPHQLSRLFYHRKRSGLSNVKHVLERVQLFTACFHCGSALQGNGNFGCRSNYCITMISVLDSVGGP